MPLISEQEFNDFVDLLDDPLTTPEQKELFSSGIRKYRDQQDELGLSLTPNLDLEIATEAKKERQDTLSLFSDVKKVSQFIPQEYSSIFDTDDEQRALYANRVYLEKLYGDVEYIGARQSYINEFAPEYSPKTELEFYNVLKGKVEANEKTFVKRENSSIAGFESATKGETYAEAVARLQKEKADEFDVESFTEQYNKRNTLLAPFKKDMQSFMNSMSKYMDNASDENDKKVLENFSKKLVDLKPVERRAILTSLAIQSQQKGKEFAESNKNLIQEGFETFGRIYSDAMFGGSTKAVEKAIPNVPTTGKVLTTFKAITTPEEADAFVKDQYMLEIYTGSKAEAERRMMTEPFFGPSVLKEGVVEREITSEETKLIEKAKVKAQKSVEIEREIQNLGKSLDPIREGWQSTMASGTASTLAITPLAFFSGGAVIASSLYADIEYNELRREYPTMDIRDAENISLVSGALQGALDKFNVNFVKRGLPNVGKLIAGQDISKVLGTRLVKNLVGTSVVENLVELGQDYTTPVVQSLFAAFKKDIPEAEWGTMDQFLKSRADVAIGMLPLVLLGVGGSSFADKINLDKTLRDEANMKLLGIQEQDVTTILQLTQDGNQDAALTAFTDAWTRRVVSELQPTAKTTSESLIDTAKGLGVIPDIYTANNEFVVRTTDKNNKILESRFSDYNQAVNFATTSINDTINKSTENIVDILQDNKNISTADLTMFDNSLNDKLNVLSQLNGVSEEELSSLNSIFGTTAENNDLIVQFASALFNKQTTLNDVTNKIGNLIANNSSASISDFIESEAKSKNISSNDYISQLLNSTDLTSSKSFNHVLNTARANIGRILAETKALNSAERKAVESGMEFTQEDITAQLETSLPIVTERAFIATTEKRKTELTNAFNFDVQNLGIPVTAIPSDVLQRETNRRAALYKTLGRLTNAKNNKIKLSDLADVNAVLDENLTLADINKLSNDEKITKVDQAITKIEESLVKSNKNAILLFKEQLKSLQLDGKVKAGYEDFVNTIINAIDSTNAEAQAALIYSKLYPENGVPNLTDTDFYSNIQEYYALKFLGNLNNKSADQLNQSMKFIRELHDNIASGSSIEFFEQNKKDLVSAKEELMSNRTLVDRRKALGKTIKNVSKGNWLSWFSDTKLAMKSFFNNHLTFASMLEVAFPSEQSGTLLMNVKEISSIQKKIDDGTASQSDFERQIFLRNGMGKNITPTMQRISDDINDAMNNIQLDNESIQDKLNNDIQKIFGINNPSWMNKRVKNTLIDMKDITKGIDIIINGSTQKLSTSFAAYILNISDQGIYNAQLEEKGFDSKVISEINKKLPIEVQKLRKVLNKRIVEEINTTNSTYKRVFGFGIPMPRKNFSPVQGKNRQIALVTPYDIQYQSGTFNADVGTLMDTESNELDLNIIDQSVNMLSMFDSYMYQSIHKRNLMAPLIAAKNVLTNKEISDVIEESFGRPYIERLNTQLNAFETNGIRDKMFDQYSMNRVRKALTNISRGAMGFRLSTILVNTLSSGNTLLDTSIPFGTAFRSYIRVLAGAIPGINYKSLKGYDNKLMKQRMRMGANSLISMSKSQTLVDRPTFLSEAANISLSPMSKMDAWAGSLAAMAAFDAHWRMQENAALESGITLSEEELNNLATEGMARTINKTFQPNIIAGKAVFEMTNNPFIKLLSMFMSEARKSLGLEITAIKKNGIFSAETARMILVNHFLIGGISFLIRAGVKDLLTADEEKDDEIYDWSKAMVDMLIGPLSATFIAGTILTEAGYGVHNLLINAMDVDEKSIPVFSSGTPIAQAGKGVVSGVDLTMGVMGMMDVIDQDEEYTEEQFIKDLNNSLKGLSVFGGTSLGGMATMSNIVKQFADAYGYED